MSTLFQDAASWLSDQLADADGRSVVYKQGAGNLSVTAVPRDATYEVVNGEGVNTEIQSRDWIILASLLSSITPRPGDRIEETVGASTLIFEVMPLENMPCVEWHDSSGIMLVLHSKRIQ